MSGSIFVVGTPEPYFGMDPVTPYLRMPFTYVIDAGLIVPASGTVY